MYETTVRVRPGHRSPAMVSTCKKIIVCVYECVHVCVHVHACLDMCVQTSEFTTYTYTMIP